MLFKVLSTGGLCRAVCVFAVGSVILQLPTRARIELFCEKVKEFFTSC